MFKLSPLLCFAFLFCSTSKSNLSYAKPQVDSVFVNWNRATFLSLERQIQLSTDSAQKASYENRLSAIKSYINIKEAGNVNIESVRYKFLNELLSKPQNTVFYVIEANESGVKVLLRNFVVYTNSEHTANIDFYLFNGKWKKNGNVKIKDFKINDLKEYITGNGFNYDDIIVTKFLNSEVKESEYYLYGTLSISSGIKRILDSYRKENFVSDHD